MGHGGPPGTGSPLPPTGSFIIGPVIDIYAMVFDNLPTDVPEEYLSGAAGFVASDGEKTEGMQKPHYAWVLNELVGLARVPTDGDGRASQKVVDSEEAGDEKLGPSDYTGTVFDTELSAWARELL